MHNEDHDMLKVGKRYRFYGVDGNMFKLNTTVLEAVEDESDGYRSYLGSIENRPNASRTIFFKRALDTVEVQDGDDSECSGWKLVSVKDGHVWLEVGTDTTDDYYPCFVFRYNPRVPK
jgi:hypothetical protein